MHLGIDFGTCNSIDVSLSGILGVLPYILGDRPILPEDLVTEILGKLKEATGKVLLERTVCD